MAATRRSVLKAIALGSMGMVLGGKAGRAMGRPVRALAGAAAEPTGGAAVRPIVALIDGDPAASVFLHGAGAATGSRLRVQKVGRDLAFMLNFERRLRSGQPLRVIGLLDDASAILVVDMARSAGARLQWLGQHTAEVGFTHHHLLTMDIAGGCFRQLGRQLHDLAPEKRTRCRVIQSTQGERHDEGNASTLHT